MCDFTILVISVRKLDFCKSAIILCALWGQSKFYILYGLFQLGLELNVCKIYTKFSTYFINGKVIIRIMCESIEIKTILKP